MTTAANPTRRTQTRRLIAAAILTTLISSAAAITGAPAQAALLSPSSRLVFTVLAPNYAFVPAPCTPASIFTIGDPCAASTALSSTDATAVFYPTGPCRAQTVFFPPEPCLVSVSVNDAVVLPYPAAPPLCDSVPAGLPLLPPDPCTAAIFRVPALGASFATFAFPADPCRQLSTLVGRPVPLAPETACLAPVFLPASAGRGFGVTFFTGPSPPNTPPT